MSCCGGTYAGAGTVAGASGTSAGFAPAGAALPPGVTEGTGVRYMTGAGTVGAGTCGCRFPWLLLLLAVGATYLLTDKRK